MVDEGDAARRGMCRGNRLPIALIGAAPKGVVNGGVETERQPVTYISTVVFSGSDTCVPDGFDRHAEKRHGVGLGEEASVGSHDLQLNLRDGVSHLKAIGKLLRTSGRNHGVEIAR